jgi:hypothetical protein
MSKNTKHKNYKVYLRLLAEEDKLNTIRKNLGYRELPKPVQHGYNAYLVLREDIARRDDAFIYQHLIDEYSYETWSKTPEFYIKKKNYILDKTPKFKHIDENLYDRLNLRVKKFFYHDKSKDFKSWDGSVRKKYICSLPPYYFVMKVKKSYLTHEKIVDNELERQINFIKDKLQVIRDTSPVYNNNGFAEYRRAWSKKDRQFNKMALRKNVSMEFAFDDWEPINWGDTDWTDWCSSSAWSHDPQEFKYKTRSQAKWMYW